MSKWRCAMGAAMSACATLTRGTTQQFVVETTPEGAAVKTSAGYNCPSTPCTFSVQRKDAFQRAFEQQCPPDAGIDAMNACGAALLPDYKFPDEKCLADSPLAELDVAAKVAERPADSATEKAEERGKGKSQ